jgi:hypothetical protein
MKIIKMFNDDEIKWKKVFTTSKPIQANIIEGSLQNDGIRVVKFNKRDSSYTSFGEVELYVPEEDYEMAVKLISGLDQD